MGLGIPRLNPDTEERLCRTGIIDVGSNSVRLVVFDGAARAPAYFFNEKVSCGLGESLRRSGQLHPQGRERALRAIRRFSQLADGMQLSSLTAVATAAVREAFDGPGFCAEVKSLTGIDIHIASGEEEARLSAQGVFFGCPDADGIVCDFGGSSTELVEVSNRTVGRALTEKLGHLSLGMNGSTKTQRGLVRNSIARTRKLLDGDYACLFLVGGSWRVLGRLDMERNRYPLKVIENYQMTCESALSTVAWARHVGADRLRKKGLVSEERQHGINAAGLVLTELVAHYKPDLIQLSGYGLREGILYDRMPVPLRRLDPLLEACFHSEKSSARLPGFGSKLYEFVRPLFKFRDEAFHRLAYAACLLHDVTWRAHPDYRAEISFDNATRANLGGITHAARIFIALALFHRYRNSRGKPPAVYAELLNARDAEQAEILGKAMRFGAMFSATSVDRIGRLKFRSKKHVLTLILPESFQDIFGEVVEMRFHSLATAMDCEPEVEIV